MSSLLPRVENIVRIYTKQLKMNKLHEQDQPKEGEEEQGSNEVRVSISAEGKRKQIQSQIAPQLVDELSRRLQGQ